MYQLDGTVDPTAKNPEGSPFTEVERLLDSQVGGIDADSDRAPQTETEEAQPEEDGAQDGETSGSDEVEAVGPEEYQTLVTGLESLEKDITLLRHLQYTISREGVSEADINTLKTLQERHCEEISGLGVEEFGFFTPERSTLSLDVAQESFTRTLIATVKRWVKKILDFIKASYRFLKKHLLPEREVNRQIDLYYRKVDYLFDVVSEVGRLNHMGGAGFSEWGRKYQRAMLNQLPQTDLTLVVIRGSLHLHSRSFHQAVDDVVPAVETILRETEVSMEILINGGDVNQALQGLTAPFGRLRDIHEDVANRLVALHSTEHLADSVNTDYLKTKPDPALGVGYQYEAITRLIDRVGKNLTRLERGITRLGGESTQSDVDAAVKLLSGYNESVNALVAVANALQQASKLRLEFLKLYYELLERALQYHYDGIKDTAPSSRNKEQADALIQKAIERLRTMR